MVERERQHSIAESEVNLWWYTHTTPYAMYQVFDLCFMYFGQWHRCAANSFRTFSSCLHPDRPFVLRRTKKNTCGNESFLFEIFVFLFFFTLEPDSYRQTVARYPHSHRAPWVNSIERAHIAFTVIDWINLEQYNILGSLCARWT